jgi:glycosyltransferase involved in cell wall biosynthesis
MPTISIIIPAYNAENTILKTINSVQQQTFSDFELIVIINGSTDGTLELLKTVEDKRLKIFTLEKNAGPARARNHGIAQATGEFITFIDADDIWTPDKLELQLAALRQNPEAGVAYSWTCVMTEDGQQAFQGEPLYFKGNVYPDMLFRNFISSGSNVMIRRQAVESVGVFDTTFGYSEDWDYFLRLARDWPFVVVPKTQIFYRQSSSSLSSTNLDALEDAKFAILERAFQMAPPKLQYLKNRSLAGSYLTWAQLCFTRMGGEEGVRQAQKKLFKAIQLYPKILTDKRAITLGVKLLLIRVLSPKVSSSFLQFIRRSRATRIQKG